MESKAHQLSLDGRQLKMQLFEGEEINFRENVRISAMALENSAEVKFFCEGGCQNIHVKLAEEEKYKVYRELVGGSFSVLRIGVAVKANKEDFTITVSFALTDELTKLNEEEAMRIAKDVIFLASNYNATCEFEAGLPAKFLVIKCANKSMQTGLFAELYHYLMLEPLPGKSQFVLLGN